MPLSLLKMQGAPARRQLGVRRNLGRWHLRGADRAELDASAARRYVFAGSSALIGQGEGW